MNRKYESKLREKKTVVAVNLADNAGHLAYLDEQNREAPNFPRADATRYQRNGNYKRSEKDDPVYSWLAQLKDLAWKCTKDRDPLYDHVMYAPRSFYLGSVVSMAGAALDRIEKRQMKEDEYNLILQRNHEIVRWANSSSLMGAPNGINLLDKDGNV